MNKYLTIAAAAMFSIGMIPNLGALTPAQPGNAYNAAVAAPATTPAPQPDNKPMILARRAL